MNVRRIVYTVILLWLCVSLHTNLFSQAAGDYRTRNPGNWNGTNVWQRYNGSSWVNINNALDYPTATDGVITIRHTVTMNLAYLEVDQLVIESGAKLAMGINLPLLVLNVVDGPGVDLVNNGVLEVTDSENSDSRINIIGQMINNNYVEVQVDCHLNVYGTFDNRGTVQTDFSSIQSVGEWYGQFYVYSGATLKCAPNSVIQGGGDFALNDEATIEVGSPQGINEIGTNTGNIRTTRVRTFSPDAYYVYNGTADQVTGTALTQASGVRIANTAGKVTFTKAVDMYILYVTLGAKANLGTHTHSAGVVNTPIASQTMGSCGSSASSATHQNDIYFDVQATGIIQLLDFMVFTYSSPSTFTSCATDTAFYAVVETWGGGGRGGTRSGSGSNSTGAGGGGGGGAYSRDTILIIPGHEYTVFVGGGSETTSPGDDSWFSYINNKDSAVVLAKGGSSVGNNNATGAAGGNRNQGIGAMRYSGGAGRAGVYNNNYKYGGGGGSSAGVNTNGNSPPNNQHTPNPPPSSRGAEPPTGGGRGGHAKYGNGGPGSNGLNPGGGGGGALKDNTNDQTINGGRGGDGRVKISYTPMFPAIYLKDTHLVECQGVTNLALYYDSIKGCPDMYMIDFSAVANDVGFQDVAYTTLPLDSTVPIVIPANAPGGIYQGVLTVKNGDRGYPFNVIFTVEVNEIKFTTTGNDVSCYGANDGSITVHINSNNNSPYTFSINNGVNYNATATGTYPDFTITNLSPATYKIRIKDKFGCTTKVCP